MREPDTPFEAPWQAQLFAMTVALNEAGAFAWSDWAELFGAELARRGDAAAGQGGYYEAWLVTFEEMLARHGIATAEEISTLTKAWHAAAHATPHGATIKL